MKKTRKLLCLMLVFGLVFTSGIFSFAEEPVEEPVEEPADVCELCFEEECICEADLFSVASADFAVGRIGVNWVQIINGGAIQALYRDSVYSGAIGVNGESADAYYTTSREFNLKDPRIFNVEFFVPAEALGSADPAEFLDTVSFTYGGFALSAWGNGNTGRDLRGGTPIMNMTNRTITPVDGGFSVTADIRVDSPWTATNSGNNIPYAGYIAGGQGHFGAGQTADNRAWWQSGPAYQGIGREYTLEAVSAGVTLAATDVHIGVYEGMYSWLEMNEFSQDLIEAITGSRVPISVLDERPIGMMAAGYVAKGADGKYVRGNAATDVYVEVHIIGYGLTDNYKPENINFNNYSRFNAQWNIVVAKTAKTVDDYLKTGGTMDTINNNPQLLIDRYKDAAPEDIDLVTVYYQNNVHSDEVTGTESMIYLIDHMIEGGQAGKNIPYKTVATDDINWRYLYPAPGYASGGTNQLIAGVAGVTRLPEAFDTGAALEKFIFVSTLCSNPDGKAGMRRVNRYGIDLNRDAIFSTQPEAISLTRDLAKWNPLVMNEWHGYVGNMLIEPCTAPHAPTYEYDLVQNNMLQLAYASGKAVLGSTGYNTFLVPWDHYDFGDWDDGGNIYAPMMAMLYGTMGYTIEFPHSNTDSFEAGNAINYAMLNTLMYGSTGFNPGNSLNGRLPEFGNLTTLRDDHSGDIKYSSMRKASIMNLLEHKLRGIENRDEMSADKYYIDRRNDTNVVVGRARVDDGQGGKLPFFPDYIIIPVADGQQYNVAEGIRALNFIMERGVNVSVSKENIVYRGVTYPAGSYVIDMKQGNRNFAFEVMGKGYDATYFGSMYADIYCNFPDVRGFDSVQVWNRLNGGADLFAGKLDALTSVVKKADISGEPADFVIFKSQSTDAVRFVNLLLSGRSSGPSYAGKGDVWMLRNNLPGVANGAVGTKSDYVIRTSDLIKIENLVDNPDLGIKGCHIVGEYIEELPEEAAKLVEPIITFTATRTAQTGAALWWVWDDYLGFNMRNADGTDYNGGANLRAGSNVIVTTTAPTAALINEVNNNKLGLVLIANATTLTNANFGLGNTAAPTTVTFTDVAVNGAYNVDDSLFSANYAVSTTMYGRGTHMTGVNVPLGAKTLFKSLPVGSDAFIGGFQNTSGSKTTFGDRTMAISALAKAGAGKPAQILYIGQNMNFRSHYHKLYPMVATAIFAGAAGILDDQVAPAITSATFSDGVLSLIAEDGDDNDYKNSGIADGGYSLYVLDGEDYDFVASNSSGDFPLTSGNLYKAVVTDWAGNNFVQLLGLLGGKLFVYDQVDVTDPTCTTKGYTSYTDNATGNVFVGKYVAALGHDFEQFFYGIDLYNECQRDGCEYRELVPIVSMDAKFISIVETAKNSRVWVLTFDVAIKYSNGMSMAERYTVDLQGNNANLDGKFKFGADHDLAGYTLTYDIKGNGSNIKAFSIKQN